MGMANLQRMALQMQQEMERVQAELAETKVEGSSGGGVVRALVTGKQELVSITIDPSAVDPDDVEMLEDLVLAAIHDAMSKVADISQQAMGGLDLGGLGGPGGGLGGLLGG
jgi:DNA-binding YbaB/EbfC family protein